MIYGCKVILRPVLESDLEKFKEWDDDHDIVRWAGKKFPSHQDIYIWYNSLRRDRTRLALSILKYDGDLIGEIELEHICWKSGSAELKVFIGQKHLWDQGYGTDAIATLITYVEQRTRLVEVYLRVARDNIRALRCYEKCGFIKRGILKAGSRAEEGFHDLILMVLRLKQRRHASLG